MGNEASKTTANWPAEIKAILRGTGIDIGAGADPVCETAFRFDQSEGDANRIDEFVDKQFDFVFSSHCLEHMNDPFDALRRWWKLARPGGHMILIVPDEDLYEQGFWPSLFNEDHKWTFTTKESSWSPVSVNVNQLVASLGNARLISMQLQSDNFDHQLLLNKRLSRQSTMRLLRLSQKLNRFLSIFRLQISRSMLKRFHIPADQTSGTALAQIQIILRKEGA